MYYKCYYHPKRDSQQTCQGCKLPVCNSCIQADSLCPECVRKRSAVQDLHLMRRATAAKARVASSTTARLRLALRQVGPLARRARGEVASGGETALLATAPLPTLAWQQESLPVDARSARGFRETVAQRKGHWTYDPDRVAYRPQPVKAPRATAVVRPAPAWQGWFASFFTGLMLSAVLWVLTVIVPAVLKGKPAQLPLGHSGGSTVAAGL